jgi:small subunit ribosomal protein S6
MATLIQKPREYETIYILQPQVDPDEADRIAARITDVVARLEGKLTKLDNWGKRRLAYPIRKHTRGVFVLVRYIGIGDIVAEVERNLRLLDQVMRHQTVCIRVEGVTLDVAVDPEEVKFRRLEVTEDEEEPNLEQRLGMLEEQRPRRSDNEFGDDEFGDDGMGDDEDTVTAPRTAKAATPDAEKE